MFVGFILDTSPSMNQPTGSALTLLDCAKSAIEHFIKVKPDRFRSSQPLASLTSYLSEQWSTQRARELTEVLRCVCTAFHLGPLHWW